MRTLIHNVKARHRQRQLHIVIAAFVSIGEILQVKWNVSRLQITATAQFVRHVLGNVFRPTFSSIERNDANRIAVLSGEEILNDRF